MEETRLRGSSNNARWRQRRLFMDKYGPLKALDDEGVEDAACRGEIMHTEDDAEAEGMASLCVGCPARQTCRQLLLRVIHEIGFPQHQVWSNIWFSYSLYKDFGGHTDLTEYERATRMRSKGRDDAAVS